MVDPSSCVTGMRRRGSDTGDVGDAAHCCTDSSHAEEVHLGHSGTRVPASSSRRQERQIHLPRLR